MENEWTNHKHDMENQRKKNRKFMNKCHKSDTNKSYREVMEEQ